jgi:hypothetical protein
MGALQFEFPERAVVPLPERNKPPQAVSEHQWELVGPRILFITRDYGNHPDS